MGLSFSGPVSNASGGTEVLSAFQLTRVAGSHLLSWVRSLVFRPCTPPARFWCSTSGGGCSRSRSVDAGMSPTDAGADGLGFYSTSTIIGSPFLIARNTTALVSPPPVLMMCHLPGGW